MSRPHRPRGLLVFMALLLAGGAIINVAVAWGCAMWSATGTWWRATDVENLPSEDLPLIPTAWLTASTASNELLMISTERMQSFGFSMDVVESSLHHFGAMEMGPGRIVQIYRSGWPWRSLECHAVVLDAGNPIAFLGRVSNRALEWHGGAATPDFMRPRALGHDWAQERGLPFRVCPLATVGNSVAYAAVCWLLFAAPFAVRRYRGGRRIKRGLCPACAYPIGTSNLCTECGKPVCVRPVRGEGM